jgi:hypothetical protein
LISNTNSRSHWIDLFIGMVETLVYNQENHAVGDNNPTAGW